MEEHFNELSPSEAERLAILSEECAEIIQAVGKILRHGYDSCHPNDVFETRNRENLERELGDLQCILYIMFQTNDINHETINRYMVIKKEKIGKYLHHNAPNW